MVISVSKKDIPLKSETVLSRIRRENLVSEIGALCHVFRDIDVFSAFPEAALLGATLGKALKMSISSKIAP